MSSLIPRLFIRRNGLATSLVPRPLAKKKNVSLLPRGLGTRLPGNLPKFKLLTSATLELAVPIRFQDALRDRCRIAIAS